MREIDASQVTEAIATLCVEANCFLAGDVRCALCTAEQQEPFAPAREILHILCRNEQIARQERMPICQDTGMAVVFAQVGQDVHITGDFQAAVNEGVRKGYTEGLLRKSVVGDPLRRVNTGDNTGHPACAAGARGHAEAHCGAQRLWQREHEPAENAYSCRRPGGGEANGVANRARRGREPCPPMVLGIGIGGDFERWPAAMEALIALDQRNSDPYYAALEEELLAEINRTGIGPQGLGGETTALGLHILTAPTHIAGLPVAVNVSCHVTRHQSITL